MTHNNNNPEHLNTEVPHEDAKTSMLQTILYDSLFHYLKVHCQMIRVRGSIYFLRLNYRRWFCTQVTSQTLCHGLSHGIQKYLNEMMQVG